MIPLAPSPITLSASEEESSTVIASSQQQQQQSSEMTSFYERDSPAAVHVSSVSAVNYSITRSVIRDAAVSRRKVTFAAAAADYSSDVTRIIDRNDDVAAAAVDMTSSKRRRDHVMEYGASKRRCREPDSNWSYSPAGPAESHRYAAAFLQQFSSCQYNYS